MSTDVQAEIVALQAQGLDRYTAVERLRAEHEAAARALLGLSPGAALVAAVRQVVEAGGDVDTAAIDHLAAAEALQWEIGTWASGSGEGLASMWEVRTLQLARAWLLAGRAPAAEVRALVDAVVNDANRIAERHRRHAEALLGRLGG